MRAIAFRFRTLHGPRAWARTLGCVVAGLALLAPAGLRGEAPGSSTRSGPAYYRAGQTVTLTNWLSPLAAVWLQTLTEQVPSQWTVTNISDAGSYDAASGNLRWMFFDNQVRQVRYTLRASASASSPVALSGTASFDGENIAVGGLLELSPEPPPAGTIVRDLPATYHGGGSFAVALAVTPEAGVDFYTVAETVPIGWNITSISHAGAAYADGTIRWGPFLDATARSLTYNLTAPAPAATNAGFHGLAAFGAVSVTTAGATNVPPAPAMGGSAARDLPANFRPGKLFTNTIAVVPNTNTLFCAVAETLPAGWSVTNISHGGFVSETLQQIKWGPFLDSTPRRLTCEFTPPANATGVVTFTGQAQFDTVSVDLSGGTQITGRPVGGGSVVRQLPGYYVPQQALTVSLTVTPDDGVSAQGVEDFFPAGWTVDPITIGAGGSVPPADGKVRWLFLDGLPRVLTYTLRPPVNVTGAARFTGQGSFDDVTVGSSGATNLWPQPSGTATRQLPAFYIPGHALTVALSLAMDTNVLFLTVVDTPPAGWPVETISHGGAFDPTNGVVRWILDAGLAPTGLTYRVVAPGSATQSGLFTGAISCDSFAAVVGGDTNLPPNLPPSVSAIPDQSTPDNVPLLIAVLVSDAETPAANLVVELTHTNSALLPPAGLSLNRVANWFYLAITPQTRRHGVDRVTLTVQDNASTVTRAFALLVEDSNTPPIVAPVASQELNRGDQFRHQLVVADAQTPTGPFEFTLVGSPAGLAVSAGGWLEWNLSAGTAAGTYPVTVRVSDLEAPPGLTEVSFNLTVRANATTISAPPTGQSACSGATATFSVTAAGDRTFAYSWHKHSNAGWGSAWAVSGSGATFRASATQNNLGDPGCVSLSLAQDINSPSGIALGLSGGPGGDKVATRTFPALTSGDVISVDLDNGSLDTAGARQGFSLQTAGGADGLRFYFRQGSANYKFADRDGEHDTGLAFQRTGLRVQFVLGAGSAYTLRVQPCGGAVSQFAGAYSGALAKLKLFNTEPASGPEHQVFFNHLWVGGWVDDADNYAGDFAGQDKGDAAINSGNGSHTYTTPTLGLSDSGASYRVLVISSDGALLSELATLTVTALPEGGPDAFSTPPNTAAAISAAKFLMNDTGAGLAIVSVQTPTAQGGSVSFVGGTLTYTPATGFWGLDTFTYTLRNQSGCTVNVPVTATVGPGSGPGLNAVRMGIEGTGASAKFVSYFAGIPGVEYTVQHAPGPTGPWTKLQNYPAPTSNTTGHGIGVFRVEELLAPSAAGFYRTISPSY